MSDAEPPATPPPPTPGPAATDGAGAASERHRHARERTLRTFDRMDPGHARAHADVWLRTSPPATAIATRCEHVTLAVEAGSLLAVVGPNGAGKSTLLKLMAGLLQPWSGRVEVLGAPAGREARRVAYVPQAELVDWALPGHGRATW